MDGDSALTLGVSLLLLVGNAFFVAAEYGLVGARRSRIDALARKGNRNAQLVLAALDTITKYVAGVQIAITLFSIAIGALTEEWLTGIFLGLLGPLRDEIPHALVSAIAILVVAYPLVVFAELVPKYVTLKHADRVALATVRPLRFFVALLGPLVWAIQRSGALILRPFGIDMEQVESSAISREELSLLIRASRDEGEFEETHSAMIGRALKLDRLDAADIMIHRLDINWLDLDPCRDTQILLKELAAITHSRIPVCNADIDEVLGIVYLQDVVRHFQKPGFTLEQIMRPAEFVPESLTLDKIVVRMREAKTQILIVRDEYGGTSGLLTLEDVIEEVFGDLEDRLESERPPIERIGDFRITARAEVRYDELFAFLNREREDADPFTTETLATIVVDKLGRVPRLGDAVDLSIGTLKVENMARQRITRIALYLPRHP